MAASLGLPSCASTELSGLYGLELRAVTAALNASILPIALRTASYVEEGVNAAGIDAPVMVMRGDGGATDLAGLPGRAGAHAVLRPGGVGRRRPALHRRARRRRRRGRRHVDQRGRECKLGRPSLSYVTVASHATALRAVDVRVVGVAGGSMLRASTRQGVRRRAPLARTSPGCPYACFTDATRLDGRDR